MENKGNSPFSLLAEEKLTIDDWWERIAISLCGVKCQTAHVQVGGHPPMHIWAALIELVEPINNNNIVKEDMRF